MDQLLCCATDTSLFFYLQSGLWLKLPLVSLCSRVCELAIEGETQREREIVCRQQQQCPTTDRWTAQILSPTHF